MTGDDIALAVGVQKVDDLELVIATIDRPLRVQIVKLRELIVQGEPSCWRPSVDLCPRVVP